MTDSFDIVIGSAGRRLYLLRWFRAAMDTLGIPGRIIVTEGDPSSAAFTAGDEAVLMPPYSDSRYEDAMLQMVDEYQPAMFVSLNDWELAKLGSGLGNELRSRGVVVPGIADEDIAIVTDKLRLMALLSNAGIPTPQTVLASDGAGMTKLKDMHSRLVIKDRMGSGSSGLQLVDSSDLNAAIDRLSLNQPTQEMRGNPLDDLVVQPFIAGVEYGVDIIGTFDEPKEREFRVLARRKIRMRAGETDKAQTVDPGVFLASAVGIGEILQPTGLIDVDMLRDSSGTLHVIDVNPRFGGGYPFVHLAGADVPLYYLSSLTGKFIDDSWAAYKQGVISAKFEEIRVSARDLCE